jgi:hypothetical protein
MCCLEMPLKDVSFVDAFVGEKSTGCLSVCPILASHGYAFPYCGADLLQQAAKSLTQPNIRKFASRNLALDPRRFAALLSPFHEAPSESFRVLAKESQPILLPIQKIAKSAPTTSLSKCG